MGHEKERNWWLRLTYGLPQSELLFSDGGEDGAFRNFLRKSTAVGRPLLGQPRRHRQVGGGPALQQRVLSHVVAQYHWKKIPIQ